MIHYVLHTKVFLPDEHHDTVAEIDFEKLYQAGIRLLLIDLDNTLIPYDEYIPNANNRALFKTLEHLGFEVIIISNNHKKRVVRFCETAELSCVYSAKKPLKIGFKKALKCAKRTYTVEETCVIGDQIMTDVFGARRMKFYIILVMPIKRQSEKWYTKFNRRLERFLLKRMKKKHPEAFIALHMEKR